MRELAGLATEIVHDNRQLDLPFELPPANDNNRLNDPFEISRWLDDGGALTPND